MEHDLPPELAGRRDDLYARVTKRGRFLRYRRIAAVGVIIAAVIAVPVVAVAVARGGNHGTDRVAVGAPTSSSVVAGANVAGTTTSTVSAPPGDLLIVCGGAPPAARAPSIGGTSLPPSVPIVLANVIGMAQHLAIATAQQLGLCVKIELVENTGAAAGYVLRSSPAPGARVARGSVVTLTVTAGPQQRSTSPNSTPLTSVVPVQVAPSPPAPQPTTTTALVCRNSYNPACGPFRWDPPVHNQPATVAVVSVVPAAPKVGDSVTFTVHATDPDSLFYPNASAVMVPSPGKGVIMPIGCGIDTTLGDGASTRCNSACPAMFTRYGPWDTPRPGRPGDLTMTFTHAYLKAGTYRATFFANSVGNCERAAGAAPYGSTASVTITVNVSP